MSGLCRWVRQFVAMTTRRLLHANITNAHPKSEQRRSILSERFVNSIDIKTVVLRVPRTDPVAAIVAPWLVHHPRHSVHVERETIVRPRLSPDRGDSVNGTQDAPDSAHRYESIADLKGVQEAITPSDWVGFQAVRFSVAPDWIILSVRSQVGQIVAGRPLLAA